MNNIESDKTEEQKTVYENKRGDLIILTNEKNYIFLEYLNPIVEYNLPLTSKVIYSNLHDPNLQLRRGPLFLTFPLNTLTV
jgi:hypothetical protein